MVAAKARLGQFVGDTDASHGGRSQEGAHGDESGERLHSVRSRLFVWRECRWEGKTQRKKVLSYVAVGGPLKEEMYLAVPGIESERGSGWGRYPEEPYLSSPYMVFRGLGWAVIVWRCARRRGCVVNDDIL